MSNKHTTYTPVYIVFLTITLSALNTFTSSDAQILDPVYNNIKWKVKATYVMLYVSTITLSTTSMKYQIKSFLVEKMSNRGNEISIKQALILQSVK